MKKTRWLKSPKTTNEKKQNQDGWCRPKRRPNNLVDRWDDKPHCYQKSWKKFRRKQYYINGRGQKHSIILPSKTRIWILEEYFKNHNIPYRIERIKESRIICIPIRKNRQIGKVPNYITKHIWVRGKLKSTIKHQSGYRIIYEWYIDGYKKCRRTFLKEYKVIWWNNKNIGIEYII